MDIAPHWSAENAAWQIHKLLVREVFATPSATRKENDLHKFLVNWLNTMGGYTSEFIRGTAKLIILELYTHLGEVPYDFQVPLYQVIDPEKRAQLLDTIFQKLQININQYFNDEIGLETAYQEKVPHLELKKLLAEVTARAFFRKDIERVLLGETIIQPPVREATPEQLKQMTIREINGETDANFTITNYLLVKLETAGIVRITDLLGKTAQQIQELTGLSADSVRRIEKFLLNHGFLLEYNKIESRRRKSK